MSIIENIQKGFFLKKSLRKNRQMNPDKAFVPLNKAKEIGIVCDFRNPTNHPVATHFYRQIAKEGINIKVLLLLSEKRIEINQYDYEKLFPKAEVFLVCPEDLNIWKIPKQNIIGRFISSSFDIAFRLDLMPDFTIDTIVLSTKSKMYAGVDHPEIPYIDFSIELSNNSGLNGLASNLIEYLDSLNSKKKRKDDDTSSINPNRLF